MVAILNKNGFLVSAENLPSNGVAGEKKEMRLVLTGFEAQPGNFYK
jgi:hypothetical protein